MAEPTARGAFRLHYPHTAQILRPTETLSGPHVRKENVVVSSAQKCWIQARVGYPIGMVPEDRNSYHQTVAFSFFPIDADIQFGDHVIWKGNTWIVKDIQDTLGLGHHYEAELWMIK